MNSQKFRRYLDIVTTVLVVALFLIGGTLYLHGKFFKQQIDPEGSTIARGLTLADALKFDYKTHSRTLILAVDRDCVYCERSADFYKQLLERQSKDAGNTQLLAALPNDDWDAKQYLRKEGLEGLPYISNIKLSQLQIAVLPTLILVDRLGRVLESWSGQLDNERQQQVFEAISNRSSEVNKSIAPLGRTLKLFDETKPVHTIDFDPKLLLNLVDVDSAGNIYVQNGAQIEKRKPDGTTVEQIPIPDEVKAGAACAGSDGDFHFILNEEIITSGLEGTSRVLKKRPFPHQVSALSARYDDGGKNILILGNSVNSAKATDQVIYKFKLSNGELSELHRAQLPFTYNNAIRLGKISYTIGGNQVFVSDPFDYKIYVYSLENDSLVTTLTQPFERPAVGQKDGKFESRNIVAEDLTQGGALKQYPAIFNLDYISSKGLLLVWTSVRNSAYEQMIDIFDRDLHSVGRDFRRTNPLFSSYHFAGDLVIAPDYGFGKEFHLDFLSPLEPAYYKPTSIKTFQLLASR